MVPETLQFPFHTDAGELLDQFQQVRLLRIRVIFGALRLARRCRRFALNEAQVRGSLRFLLSPSQRAGSFFGMTSSPRLHALLLKLLPGSLHFGKEARVLPDPKITHLIKKIIFF